MDFVQVLADGQEFDGGNAEVFQVFDACRVRHARKGSGDVARDGGVLAAEAFDVCFKDDGVFPRGAWRRVVFPVKAACADDNAFWRNGGVVARVVVMVVREFVGVAVLRQAVDGFGVGVKQQFAGVKAATAVVFAIDPPAVVLADAAVRDENVPDVAAFVGAHAAFFAVVVKEAEGDGSRVAAHQGVVHALMVGDGHRCAAQRVRSSGVAEQRRFVFHHAPAPLVSSAR